MPIARGLMTVHTVGLLRSSGLRDQVPLKAEVERAKNRRFGRKYV